MNRYLKNTLKYLICSICLCPALIFAQFRLSGIVLDDSNGDPLIGASVLVKNTATGTVTDLDGAFSINVPKQAKELIISYTGFATKEIGIKKYSGGKLVVRLESHPVSTTPGCGVYIYPTANEIMHTKLLRSDKLSGAYENDIYGLARFRASATDIFRAGGNPNELHTVIMRGPVSLYGNNRPLLSMNGFYGVDERLIDPLDVQSIRFLSGGAGTASAGYQGGAGLVELVPTRSVKLGNSIRYRGQFAITEVAAFPNVGNRDDFIANRILTGDSDQLPLIDFGEDRNWTEEITEITGSQAHHLSFVHNHRSFSAETALNYRDSRGVVRNGDGFSQFNARLNLTQHLIKRRLTLNLQLIGTERNSRLVNGEIMSNAQLINPTAPIRVDSDNPNLYPEIIDRSNELFGGYYQPVSNTLAGFNPVAQLEQTEVNEQTSLKLLQLKSRLRVVDNLFLDVSYHLATNNTEMDRFESTNSFNANSNLSPGRRGYVAQSTEASKREQYGIGLDYRTRNLPFYLHVKSGFLMQSANSQGIFIGGRGLPSDAFGPNNLSVLQDIRLGQIEVVGSNTETRANGLFTSLVNEYRGFRLTAQLRYDKSSFLPAEDERKFFYGVAVSQSLNGLVGGYGNYNGLRIRAEFGRAGNNPFDNVGTGISFLSQAAFPNINVPPVAGNFSAPTIETVDAKEIGLTYDGINKLQLSVSIYDRLTTDLIVVTPTPINLPVIYFNEEDVNLRNRGVEFSATHHWRKNDFSWSGNFNLTYNQSRYESELGDFISPLSGRFGTQNISFLSSDGSPGDLLTFSLGEDGLQDINSDGLLNNDDQRLSGNGLPNFFAGFSNRLGWKNFGLHFTIGGVFCHDLYDYGEQALTQFTSGSSRNVVPGEFPLPLLRISEPVDYYVRSADYFTLDNLELSYTIKAREESHLKSLRLYLHGRRLLTITQYTGHDPTQRYAIAGESPAFGQVRPSDYLPTRLFGLGVDVTFR